MNKYSGTEEDRKRIAEFVAAGCKSEIEFEQALKGLSFVDRIDRSGDTRFAKLRTLIHRIEELRSEADTDTRSRAYVLSVEVQAKLLVKQRANLYSLLSDIPGSRIVSTKEGGWWPQGRIRKTLDGINLAGDIGEKLTTAIGWVTKLVS